MRLAVIRRLQEIAEAGEVVLAVVRVDASRGLVRGGLKVLGFGFDVDIVVAIVGPVEIATVEKNAEIVGRAGVHVRSTSVEEVRTGRPRPGAGGKRAVAPAAAKDGAGLKDNIMGVLGWKAAMPRKAGPGGGRAGEAEDEAWAGRAIEAVGKRWSGGTDLSRR